MAKQSTADAVPKVSQLTEEGEGMNRGQQSTEEATVSEENAHPKKKEEEKLPAREHENTNARASG